MRTSKNSPVPDHELTQYLLGGLSGEECERLDELSIADDDIAARLCSAENDLVDAYVRNELAGNLLRNFESHYLATDVRRQKVAMARALYAASSTLESSPGIENSMTQSNPPAESPRSRLWPSRLRFAWLAVAAVLVLSAITAWLAMKNYRLRQHERAQLAVNGALQEESQKLPAEAQSEQSLQNSKVVNSAEGEPREISHPARLMISIFLVPPTRGATTMPVATVARKDQWVRLQLALEADDFSAYQVDLMDLSNNKPVWHSGTVKSSEIRHRRALSLPVPLADLRPQKYVAEVNGIGTDGRREPLGSYVFQIAQGTSSRYEQR